MAILNFPNVIPSSIQFGIRFNTQINVSPLSGSVQTVEIPGARWVAELSFADLEPAEVRLLAAFIAQLRGASGRFYLRDLSHPTPLGSPLGSIPVVQGAGQTGTSLTTSGWTANTVGLLKAGDYIEIEGNELKILTADVTSDINGDATITFSPPLRNSPSDLSAINIDTPKTVMLLDNDDNSWATDNPGLIANMRLSCAEAF